MGETRDFGKVIKAKLASDPQLAADVSAAGREELLDRYAEVEAELTALREEVQRLRDALEAMYDRHPGCSCDEGECAPGCCPSCVAKELLPAAPGSEDNQSKGERDNG